METGHALTVLILFNSNLVRLKLYALRSFALLKPGFNSNLVRLKRYSLLYRRAAVKGFNSNLVRLKRAQDFAQGYAPSLFQFQSGTIKAPFLSDYIAAFFKFQFQSGTIKAVSLLLYHLGHTLVSIPIWYD